jgi:glycosyltransferase involved in cell wall biosynthesis
VNEHNGYIVPAGNATELAAAIGRLAGNRALMQAMGKNGYDRYMNNYNNQRVMHMYNQLFDSLLAKKSD